LQTGSIQLKLNLGFFVKFFCQTKNLKDSGQARSLLFIIPDILSYRSKLLYYIQTNCLFEGNLRALGHPSYHGLGYNKVKKLNIPSYRDLFVMRLV